MFRAGNFFVGYLKSLKFDLDIHCVHFYLKIDNRSSVDLDINNTKVLCSDTFLK